MFSQIKSYLNQNYQLIIPILSLTGWCFYSMLHENFFLNVFNALGFDFGPLYYAGQQVFVDPSHLYDTYGYFYLPIFSIIYGLLFSWQPPFLAWYIHYIFVYFLAFLSLLQLNKILLHLEVKNKSKRALINSLFMFGWPLYIIFYLNQAKFIVILSFLFVVRRELEYKRLNKEKNYLFFVINYSLLIFSLSIAPYLFFLVLIYVLHDINYKEILKKENLRKILMFVSIFLVQNFLFLVYPNLIFDFVEKGFNFQSGSIDVMIFWDIPINLGATPMTILRICCMISMLLLTLYFWIFKNNLTLESKFGYFAIALLYLNVWKGYDMLIFGFPYIYLLLIPSLKKVDDLRIYKSRSLFLFYIAAFIILIQMTYNETFFKYFPFLHTFPLNYIVYFRWLIPILLMTFCVLILRLKKFNRNITNTLQRVK
jgi:hypothetical protein